METGTPAGGIVVETQALQKGVLIVKETRVLQEGDGSNGRHRYNSSGKW